MEKRPKLESILKLVQATVQRASKNQEELPLSKFGAINVRSRQRIAEVPFLFPTLVMVIRGEKSIYYGNDELLCSPGDYLAIPAPSTYDVVNEPVDAYTSFLALYLHFDFNLVERFRRLYQFEEAPITDFGSIHIDGNDLLDSAVFHYLEILNQPKIDSQIVEHRLIEILLCLVKNCNSAHLLMSMSPKWSDRVYSLLLSNPSKVWLVKEVCDVLSVSESTLRRNLRGEDTSFRDILDEIRMGQALSEVQFTQLPISMIAENCGYASFSQFTSRFRQRFDTTPTQLRREMTEFG